MVEDSHKIWYDNECPLCLGSKSLIEKFDKKKKFDFIPFNPENNQKNSTPVPESILVKIDGKQYKKSTAVLKIFKKMGFPWSLFYGFIIIPAFIRDAVYDFVARNRGRI
jgi:predicted DCC family thiol-disulfide oxidoreductase YuxK